MSKMSDFTMVDPRGWEYDLHSVRHSPSYVVKGVDGGRLDLLSLYRVLSAA